MDECKCITMMVIDALLYKSGRPVPAKTLLVF